VTERSRAFSKPGWHYNWPKEDILLEREFEIAA
jgi:hypothetical protein